MARAQLKEIDLPDFGMPEWIQRLPDSCPPSCAIRTGP